MPLSNSDLESGHRIKGYRLIQRTAVLGICRHHFDQFLEHKLLDDGKAQHASQMQLIGYSSGKEHFKNALQKKLEGPSLEYQCLLEGTEHVYVNHNYRLKKKFNGGSHGEVWRASSLHGSNENFVIKRMFVEHGEATLESGLREVHFGTLLRGERHITRFVEYFYNNDHVANKAKTELWLVFYDEGKSLRNYLYSKHAVQGSVFFGPSAFWHRLRSEPNGISVIKEMMRQLLSAVAILHKRGITHRDIKPSNILVHHNKSSTIVKLADFGSAVDPYSFHELYNASKGPTQGEETREYQPPEVLFGEGSIAYYNNLPQSYDIWSIGVVFLEMFLGSPRVFELSSRVRTQLDAKLKGKSDEIRRKSYLLHAFEEFCIYSPDDLFASVENYALFPQSCNIGTFNVTILKRDPMKQGFRERWGVQLLWELLQWDPKKRISAHDALNHAFFVGPYTCNRTGLEFASQEDLSRYELYLDYQAKLKIRQASIVQFRNLPAVFKCAQCGRTFLDWSSCHAHVHTRKHTDITQFCLYDMTLLHGDYPQHNSSDTPTNSMYGYFQLQGRRRYMEDMHLVFQAKSWRLYAIMDGHSGLGTAAFIRDNLVTIATPYIEKLISADTREGETFSPTNYDLLEQLIFRELFRDIEKQCNLNSEKHDFSGSTLTLVLHYGEHIIVANVGDSSAILASKSWKAKTVTMDHVPDHPKERERIESSGGFVEFVGVWRVVGQLAISRSIGDKHLRQFVTSEPTVAHFRHSADTRFLCIASDGVWETLSPEDVVDLADEIYFQSTDYKATSLEHVAAKITYEAYVRGSSDNMAAMIIDLRMPSYPV